MFASKRYGELRLEDKMPTAVAEASTLGKLLNGFGIFASQLLVHNRPDFYDRAKNNLTKFRRNNEDLLKLLDHVAEQQHDERPLHLIDDILRFSREDAAGCLLLARRCLLACAFVGDFMTKTAQASKPAPAAEHRGTVTLPVPPHGRREVMAIGGIIANANAASG